MVFLLKIKSFCFYGLIKNKKWALSFYKHLGIAFFSGAKVKWRSCHLQLKCWVVAVHPAYLCTKSLGVDDLNAERIPNCLWIWSHKAAGFNKARAAAQSMHDKRLLFRDMGWSCCKRSQVRQKHSLQLSRAVSKILTEKKETKKEKNCRLLSLPSSTHSNWWFLLWLLQLEGYTWCYCEWEGCQRSDTRVPVLESHSILPWWERGLCCQHRWLDWHQQEHSIQHSAGIFLLPCTSQDAIISSILPGLLIRHCKI